MEIPPIRQDALSAARAQVGKEIERLQDQVAQIERQITNLRLKQNALTTTGLLPPELLAHVFCVCRDLALASGPREPLFWDWAVVSHVCSHWRAVAFGTPALWTQFVMRGPRAHEYAPIMLERSKAAPLLLDVAFCGPQNPRNLTAPRSVLGELHRMQDLTIRMDSMDALSQLAMSVPLTHPAPLLQRAYINRAGNWPPPPILFDGDAPNLQEITIVGMHFGWNLRADNLRILRLQEFSKEVQAVRILAALRTFRRLEELTLLHLNHEASDSVDLGEDIAPVPLLSLSKLELNYIDLALLAELIPHLQVPNLSTLTFNIRAPENDDGTLARVLPLFTGIAHLPPSDDSDDSLVFYAHDITREFAYHARTSTGLSVEGRVSWQNSLRWPDIGILSQLYSNWEPLRTRTQSAMCSFGHDFVVDTLRTWLTHKAYARVRGFEFEEEFCPTLGALAPTPDEFPLPALRKITVRKTDLNGTCPERWCPGVTIPLASVLNDVLHQRSLYGMAAIERITLQGCDIAQGDVERLCASAVCVDRH